jgi:hypothetical protein
VGKPGLKVLIDTQPPVVAVTSAERVGDEVVVTWEIQEPYLDPSKMRVDYRGPDGNWFAVDARPGVTGTARFRPTTSGALTVRVQAQDLAGNRGEQSRDVAAAAVPASPQPAPMNGVSLVANRNTLPDNPSNMGLDPVPSGVQHATTESPVRGGESPARSSGNFVPVPVQPADPAPGPFEPTGPPLAVSSPTPVNSVPLPPVQVINVTKFDLAFDVEQKGPSGVSKAEVWVTRDNGKSWIRWQESEKGDAPITVDLGRKVARQDQFRTTTDDVEGLWGFKVVLESGAGLSRGAPVAGETPEMLVDVDLKPPVVKLFQPVADPNQKDVIILRWQAVDRNMASEPITLEWSESPDGGWQPTVGGNDAAGNVISGSGMAKRLKNTGSYAWKLPESFATPKVYLRVTARDTAGNVAEAKTPSPVVVDLNRPVARIQGIIGTAGEKH